MGNRLQAGNPFRLSSALRKNEASVTDNQEYTGQQRHLCFLIPMWKEVLDFDMHASRDRHPVRI